MLTRETKRLIVRDFEEEDWQAVHAYSIDERLVYYLNWGPNTEQETKDFMARAISRRIEDPRTNYQLAIVVKKTGEIVGNCSLHVMPHRHRIGEVHCIVRRQDWGKGYGSEAMASMLDFAFRELCLHRVFCLLDPEDIGSARVLEKTGFQREGHLREHEWNKSIWRDSLLYAMLDYEWEQLRDRKASTPPKPQPGP